jgi:chromosome segregation ATPase
MAGEMGRIYEDIGALKAMVASIDAKLDEGKSEFRGIRDEFRSVRQEQVATKMDIADIKADVEAHTAAIRRIEDTLQELEKRVDPLIALRHKVGGGLVILTVVSSTAYSAWQILEQIINWTIHPTK